jgi:hypothetical protein
MLQIKNMFDLDILATERRAEYCSFSLKLRQQRRAELKEAEHTSVFLSSLDAPEKKLLARYLRYLSCREAEHGISSTTFKTAEKREQKKPTS